MQDFDLRDDDLRLGEDINFEDFSNYEDAPDHAPQMVTVPLVDFRNQQIHIQYLHSNMTRQHSAIAELFDFSRNIHAAIHDLGARVTQLERDIVYVNMLAANNTSTKVRSTSHDGGDMVANADYLFSRKQTEPKPTDKTASKRPIADDVNAEDVTVSSRTKYRKKLKVEIPSKAVEQAAAIGIPTPLQSSLQTAPPSALVSSFPATPRTPYTPGRIGPPDSYKKTTTSINKREIHNLNKSIPPVNVQLPLVPLTDTEVIVYFFNSLSKPNVSLRLYARGWGPATIVLTLNEHRAVEPPYLRNTCSVKCTTAIKNGKKTYGPGWEAEYRNVFLEADDSRATDLIRTDENDTVDYYVRALGANLKHHPSGQDAGIFTECVKYCIENNASYTMSNVFQLAIDLRNGNVPHHPASPAASDVMEPPQLGAPVQESEDSEEDWSEDEGVATPSPLTERKPPLQDSSSSVSFMAVNAPYEPKGDSNE